MTFRTSVSFYCEEQNGGSPLVGCPQLSTITGGRFLHPQLEDVPCRGDRLNFGVVWADHTPVLDSIIVTEGLRCFPKSLKENGTRNYAWTPAFRIQLRAVPVSGWRCTR